jgi:hypothetical protein
VTRDVSIVLYGILGFGSDSDDSGESRVRLGNGGGGKTVQGFGSGMWREKWDERELDWGGKCGGDGRLVPVGGFGS